MNPNPRQKIALGIVASIALVAIGIVGGAWWSSRAPMPEPPITPIAMNEPAQQGKALYWYDPMVPLTHFDKPGKSPFMDMDLVPMYASEKKESASVKIDPNASQSLGVRLATVKRIPLNARIEATGLIGFNDRDVAIVQARSGGFVERVWRLAPGDVVKVGQPLAELVVPDWAAAQQEFFAVKAFGDATLIDAARERLRLLGMPAAIIKAIEKSGKPRRSFTINAPIAGVIQTLDVRAGMSLTSGQTLAKINGLSEIWLEAAVPEAMASAVRVGDTATVQLTDNLAAKIQGRVAAVLPALNETTRTLKVRVALPNRSGRLRPGMSAQVTLTSARSETALAVPTEAVIRTGKRALVMLANDNSRFSPAEVTLGREFGTQTVIIAGLSEGQQVVASGQFLIDSEASLNRIEAQHADNQP